MIYFIQCGENGPIKIGQSDNPKERLEQLQTGSPYKLKLLWVYKGDQFTEQEIQDKFTLLHIRGEWFKPSKDIFNFIEHQLVNNYEIETTTGKFISVYEGFNNYLNLSIDEGVFDVYVEPRKLSLWSCGEVILEHEMV